MRQLFPPEHLPTAVPAQGQELLQPGVMAYSLFVGAIAFLMTLVIGRPIINILLDRGIGKKIRVEGPDSHLVKAGTPTMGGLMIFLTVGLITVLFNLAGRLSMLLPLGTIVSCGILGGVDDLMNTVGRAGAGMQARFKFVWLLLIAVTGAVVLYFFLGYERIWIPFLGSYPIGLWYLPIAVLAIMGTAHAVNLTDGLDTLAGSNAAVAFGAYAIIAFLQGQVPLVTFCFTVSGAILGFLWFNAHPAEVFMGDTGALALGATLGVVALMTGWWLLLPIIGGVFVVETLSVMLQVAFFKLTGGKRLFRMTPLHHHFELIGWSETQVTTRFWLFGIACGLIGVSLALSV